MVILRRLALLQNLPFKPRFYARKTATTTDAKMKQVHKEILRYINPYANIKIDSDINLRVYSADPHSYPDGDALVAELHGDAVKNCTASMEVKVSDDECNVEVILKKLTDPTNFHCELAVPIKAALDISARQMVQVENTYGNELKIMCGNNITTKEIRAEKIELLTYDGNINCQGILLGKSTTVEAQNKGSILLDKLQGDFIKCKTSHGNITTNCSYVESSEFETDTGCLDLKNVHKCAAVTIQQAGDLKMTGVHGNLKVITNGGSMHLQLSELQGHNIVEAKNLTECTINISEEIEKNTSLDVSLKGEENNNSITLDATLAHLSLGMAENRQQFKWPFDQEQPNSLKVVSQNSLTLGKSSWMDMMRLQMADKPTKNT